MVIPNRDGGSLLTRSILAALDAEGVREVIVVDDGSADRSRDRAVELGARVLHSPARGFAAAVNAGVEAAANTLVLLLNSDAFIYPNTVRLLREGLEADERHALCAAALVHEDGTRAKTHDRLLTLVGSLRHAASLPIAPLPEGSGVATTSFVPLACALVRRKAWEEVGGLDERYRFYFEDHDFSWRLAEAGWRIAVNWDAEAIHVEGGSSRAHDPRRWFRQYHESRLRYLRKRYQYGFLLYLAAWMPSALGHALVWLVRGDRKWAAAYLESAFAGVRS